MRPLHWSPDPEFEKGLTASRHPSGCRELSSRVGEFEPKIFRLAALNCGDSHEPVQESLSFVLAGPRRAAHTRCRARAGLEARGHLAQERAGAAHHPHEKQRRRLFPPSYLRDLPWLHDHHVGHPLPAGLRRDEGRLRPKAPLGPLAGYFRQGWRARAPSRSGSPQRRTPAPATWASPPTIGLPPVARARPSSCPRGTCTPAGAPSSTAGRPTAGGTSPRTSSRGSERNQQPLDGDYTSRHTPDGKSRFRESGVVEGDCLMCHLKGYRIDRRNDQLARRNYRWAATAGAGLGEIRGAVFTPARPDTPRKTGRPRRASGTSPAARSFNTPGTTESSSPPRGSSGEAR